MDVEKQTVGSLFVLLSAAGFGTLPILVDITLASGLNIPTILIFRFIIGLALLCLYIYTSSVFRNRYRDSGTTGAGKTSETRLRLSAPQAVIALGLGALGYALISWLFFIGVSEINAGLATIILYTYPLIVVFLGVLFLNESITQKKITSVVVTLGGIGLISGASFELLNFLGVAATFGAAVLYSFYIVVGRQALDSVNEVTLTVYVLLGAATICLLIGALSGQIMLPTGPSEWSLLVGIGVFSTGMPIFAFFAGLKRIDASKAGVLATAEPVVAVVLGGILLNESIPVPAYIGAILVISGVILVQSE